MLSLRRVSAAAATAVRRPSTAARSLLVVAAVSARSLHLEASKPSITAAIEAEPVIVFSKTHCPFCSRVKELFADLDVKHEVIELDVRADGAEIQELLRELTGQRTVPNVFIRGRHIGGCDATLDLHARDELLPLLK